MKDIDIMAINGCSSGLLWVTTVVALLVLPAQYYVPKLYSSQPDALPPPPAPDRSRLALHWLDVALLHLPPLDLFVTLTLIVLGTLTYLCEWIQRKQLEKRILKLNQYLVGNMDRLRAWDAQQEQLEATIKMVKNATSEYNLLLYLLLRQHRCLPPQGQRDHCLFEKAMDDDFAFLRNTSRDS